MYTKYKIVPFCPYHFIRTILSNTILSVYHFVHTILSVPFCPLPFCPVTLQSPVPNLQFPAVFPAHVPSRTLHHPANPLYPIIILSHPFSTPGHFSSHVLQPSHIYHCTTSLE